MNGYSSEERRLNNTLTIASLATVVVKNKYRRVFAIY